MGFIHEFRRWVRDLVDETLSTTNLRPYPASVKLASGDLLAFCQADAVGDSTTNQLSGAVYIDVNDTLYRPEVVSDRGMPRIVYFRLPCYDESDDYTQPAIYVRATVHGETIVFDQVALRQADTAAVSRDELAEGFSKS
jgi:hypothetical protein